MTLYARLPAVQSDDPDTNLEPKYREYIPGAWTSELVPDGSGGHEYLIAVDADTIDSNQLPDADELTSESVATFVNDRYGTNYSAADIESRLTINT